MSESLACLPNEVVFAQLLTDGYEWNLHIDPGGGAEGGNTNHFPPKFPADVGLISCFFMSVIYVELSGSVGDF